MESLVGYSGSESDDEDDLEEAKKTISSPQALPLEVPVADITVDLSEVEVNKPQNEPCNSRYDISSATGVGNPPIESDTLYSVSLTAHKKDMSASAQNFVSGDAEHSNYFGLDVVSTSEDSGDDEKYFAKGQNVWSKPIICFKQKNSNTACNSRSPSDEPDGKLESVLTKQSHKQNAQDKLMELPTSSFWTGTDNSDDWENPGKVWGIDNSRNNLDNKAPNRGFFEPDPHAPEIKRLKVDNIRNDANFHQVESNTLSKNCFFIHRKIAPALSQQEQCKLPTRSYISMRGHSGAVNRVKWERPEYSHLLASASMDNTVKIWNIFSSVSHCIQTFSNHSKAVKDVTWSPSGKEVLSCGYDRTARLSDVVKGVEIGKFEHQDFLTCIKYHPVNPNYILAGSKDRILCWDVRSPETCIKTFGYKHNFGQVQDIAFIQDGREFVITTDMVSRDSADRSIMVYDFSSGVILSNQVYQERYVCPRLGIHPHRAEMMAQSSGNYMCLFSTIKPYKMNRCKRFEGHKVIGYAVGCDYSPDGRFVISGGADSHLTIWDYQRAVVLQKLGNQHEIYLDVAWHPILSNIVASSTWSGDIDIWH